MSTAQPTATLPPTAEPSPVLLQSSQTPEPSQVVEGQTPADCDAEYCLFPAPNLLQTPIELAGQNFHDPTYPFGSTQKGKREVHLGVEFNQGHGTPVLAAAPGRVIVAGDDSQVRFGAWKNIYGNLVVVEHDLAEWEDPVFTLYAHLSSISVAAGEPIEVGTTLGLVGASGAAIGSHLHFEVRRDHNEPSAAQNPLLFLALPANSEGEFGRVVGAVVDALGNPVREQDLVLQAVAVASNSQEGNRYLETYAAGVSASKQWQENFVSGNLPAGKYRLTLIHAGHLYERILPVEPGSFTYLKIQLGD